MRTHAPERRPMFTQFESYERFMGRWSRLIGLGWPAFAGVRADERVLDVDAGTGVLAAAIVEC